MSNSQAAPGSIAHPPRAVGITGASGYVGGLIADAFAEQGDRIIELGRRGRDRTRELRPFTLGQPCETAMFEGLDVLVHGAYDLSLRDPSAIWHTNVGGTRSLAEGAQAAGVAKIVLISSMSAYEGSQQIYGRAKLASENLIRRIGGVAVRLGLVYDTQGGGMIGALSKLARLPLVPLLGPGARQFAIDAEQVGPAFVRLVDDWGLGGDVIGLAHPDAVAFRDILASLSRTKKEPRFISVPWMPVFTVMKLAERAGVDLPLRADSVLGLVHTAPRVINVDRWSNMNVILRPVVAPTSEAGP